MGVNRAAAWFVKEVSEQRELRKSGRSPVEWGPAVETPRVGLWQELVAEAGQFSGLSWAEPVEFFTCCPAI